MSRWGTVALAAAAGAFAAFLAGGGREGPSAAVIHSSPPGASVFVDGEFLGTTPLTAALAPGSHALRLEREGFERVEVRVSEGERCSFELVAVRYARLRVESEPCGADVRLDGAFRGRTPVVVERVAPGGHVLVVDKANRELWKAEVGLSPGEERRIEVALRDRVLEFLEAAVRSDPDDVLAWCDYAHYLFLQGDHDGAVEAYRNGLVAAYKPGVDKLTRKRIDKEIRKHYRWKTRNMIEFKEAMERAKSDLSSRFPNNPVLLRERARELQRQGRREEALGLLEKAADKWRDADTWMEAGKMALELGRGEASQRAFRRAVEAAPGDHGMRQRVASHCRIRSVKLREGRERDGMLEFAEKVLLEGIERAGAAEAKAALLQELGELCRHRKRVEEAVEHMRRAVELSADAAAAKRALRLAGYLRAQGKKELARKYYKLVTEKAQDPTMKRTAERELDRLRR